MKTRLTKTLTAVFILIAITSAFAENRSYVSFSGNYSFRNTSNLIYKHKNFPNELQANDLFNPTIDYKNGFGGAIAIGRIINQFRFELESSCRRNTSQTTTTTYVGVSGKSEFTYPQGLFTANISVMLNAYYDIPVSEYVSFYLGAGAGVSAICGDRLKRIELKQDNSETYNVRLAHNKNGNITTVFAWQVMGGVTYHINKDWELFTGYRLFGTAKPTYLTNNMFVENIKYEGVKFTEKNIPLTHIIEFGLRFKL